MNTFNSLCIGACVFMIFIGFGSAFVGSLEVFPYTLNVNASKGAEQFTVGAVNGWITLFGTSAAVIIAGILYFFNRSPVLIGVGIFSAIFWTSFLNLLPILFAVEFFSTMAGTIIFTTISTGMCIMFIGAINGMLHGSVWMK